MAFLYFNWGCRKFTRQRSSCDLECWLCSAWTLTSKCIHEVPFSTLLPVSILICIRILMPASLFELWKFIEMVYSDLFSILYFYWIAVSPLPWGVKLGWKQERVARPTNITKCCQQRPVSTKPRNDHKRIERWTNTIQNFPLSIGLYFYNFQTSCVLSNVHSGKTWHALFPGCF